MQDSEGAWGRGWLGFSKLFKFHRPHLGVFPYPLVWIRVSTRGLQGQNVVLNGVPHHRGNNTVPLSTILGAKNSHPVLSFYLQHVGHRLVPETELLIQVEDHIDRIGVFLLHLALVRLQLIALPLEVWVHDWFIMPNPATIVCDPYCRLGRDESTLRCRGKGWAEGFGGRPWRDGAGLHGLGQPWVG